MENGCPWFGFQIAFKVFFCNRFSSFIVGAEEHEQKKNSISEKGLEEDQELNGKQIEKHESLVEFSSYAYCVILCWSWLVRTHAESARTSSLGIYGGCHQIGKPLTCLNVLDSFQMLFNIQKVTFWQQDSWVYHGRNHYPCMPFCAL